MAYGYGDSENAILFEVDKCVKCRACTVACERWYQLDLNTLTSDAEAVSADDWVIPKAQTSVDNPPFVRYSCWHCQGAPCASAYQGAGQPDSGCPFGAVKIAGYPKTNPNVPADPTPADSSNPGVSVIPRLKVKGTVYIDFDLCNPASPLCRRQCVRNCFRGGYPRVGYGSKDWKNFAGIAPGGAGTDKPKAGKCMLCWDWISLQDQLGNTALAQPICVLSCPMKALTYNTRTNIESYLGANYGVGGTTLDKVPNIQFTGHVYWVSKKPFSVPLASADPFVEDHISPLFDRVLSSSVGKTLAIPGIILGALYALYRRKAELNPEAKKA